MNSVGCRMDGMMSDVGCCVCLDLDVMCHES